jgi:heat shock protein HtpX
MNNLKTYVLMGALVGLFGLAGQLLGGSQGLLLALGFAMIFNFGMYFFSDRLVLRMYGAHVVTEAQAPELYRMVDRLRLRAGLPMPVLAVAPHEQPNAFATGRSPEKAVVAVTTGILKYMPSEELEGVIAHELAHIKNRDMLIATVAAGIADRHDRRRIRASPAGVPGRAVNQLHTSASADQNIVSRTASRRIPNGDVTIGFRP